MIIDRQSWDRCDWCESTRRVIYGDVARGATGRHCVVMARCADCTQGQEVVPIDEARERVTKDGDWADF